MRFGDRPRPIVVAGYPPSGFPRETDEVVERTVSRLVARFAPPSEGADRTDTTALVRRCPEAAADRSGHAVRAGG